MPFSHLNVTQLDEWLSEKKTITIIDIRDQQSFLNGSIEQAEHIHNGNVEEFIARGHKSSPLVVCCYHGNSSQGAADYFNQQGFEDCYSLDGGYEAWAAHLKTNQ